MPKEIKVLEVLAFFFFDLSMNCPRLLQKAGAFHKERKSVVKKPKFPFTTKSIFMISSTMMMMGSL